MLLFQNGNSISIYLENKNPYVRLAVEDLRKDFLRVSNLTAAPKLVEEETSHCLIIKDNPYQGSDAIADEVFSIRCEGEKIILSANTYLGTMWGIYTFSERILGVHPCYLFNDLPIEKKSVLEIQPFTIEDAPKVAGFRGIFINDEDLLTEWKEGAGARLIDYPWYKTVIAEEVIERVVETALRLKLNLVIPASFLDIDNPPEKMLADCVAKRGIYLSQHHIEPLGLSHFTYEKYCKTFQKEGAYSFINNPEGLIEAWEYYAEKWAQYDHLVWQIGLRGKADRPVWEEAEPTDEELKNYTDYINRALQTQQDIVMLATDGKAKHFSTTLWMEGSTLIQKGFLQIPENTVVVFSDNGPNQMFGGDYDQVPRLKNRSHGIYYHLQYHDIGPHLTPQTGLDKLYYNLKKATDKGDKEYFILNVSNVREFVFELQAYAEMTWNIDAFSQEAYLENYAKLYGGQAEQAKKFVRAYYDNLPTLPTEDLRHVHAKFFNYNYAEKAEGIKNFILKDEMVVVKGAEIVWLLEEELPTELYGKMYGVLKKTAPIYKELAESIEKWSKSLPQNLQTHVQCKWWLYTKTLYHFYRWFVDAYEAKQAYDNKNTEEAREKLAIACSGLEEYLALRQCAETGEFANWYKGENKVNVIKRLLDAKETLKKLQKM